MADVNTEVEEWLTIPEAAGYLGVSEPTVYRWMRNGKLSFYKVGDSTRFKRENLDMAFEKYTGTDEVHYYGTRCVACGHSRLVPGKIQSTGNVYFKPVRTRFFTLLQSFVGMSARVCPRCGFVQLFTDTEKLDRLLREADRAEGEEAAREA